MHLELNKIHTINCIDGLKLVAPKSVQSCVSSPPYYALRDYGLENKEWPAITYKLFGFTVKVKAMKCQLGLEPTPNDFIGHLVYIYRLVRETLRDDGTVWINIGDSYAAAAKKRNDEQACRKSKLNGGLNSQIACKNQPKKIFPSIKPKDMLGIPWMLAFALREDGWFLRQDIIWHKKNCMPESCKDRCTKNHEYVFLLSKSKKYYFDQLAIAVPIAASTANDSMVKKGEYTNNRPDKGFIGSASQGNGMLKPTYHAPNGWNTGKGSHAAIDWATAENQGRGKQQRNPRPDIDTRGGNQGKGDIPAVGNTLNFLPDEIEDVEIKGSESFAPWKHNPEDRIIRSSQNFRRDNHKHVEPIFVQKSVQHRPDRPDTIPAALANRRSVWSFSTQGFKEAHFATFPKRLPELCIKAGASLYGSCGKCGAPYRRLTEKELKPGPKASYNSKPDDRDYSSDGNDAGSNRMKDGHKPGWHNETTTTGWGKTCRCQTGEIKPSVVMDMFSGAGTVPIVCVELGIDFIAMEQSPEYVKITHKRMHKVLGLFSPANKEREAVV